ncbi:MAG: FecR family protein [Spirochaetes bacterium]|nr:FecR family protein [Spirochaetota bacterium]
MKKTILLSILFSFFLALNIYAGSEPSPIAKVKLVKGKVYYSMKNSNKFYRIKTGEKLYDNTIIKTSKKANATLLLKGGSLIEIKENSRITLNKELLQKSSVSLSQGRAAFKIQKVLKQKESFKVYTPTAVAGVRGTDYEVGIADDGSLLVNVEDGEVTVNNDKEEIAVKKNQSAEASVDDSKLIKEDSVSDMDNWNKEKDKELKEKPVQKMDAVSDNLKETLEQQKKALDNLSDIKVSDEEDADKNIDSALFNQCKSEGLFIAAKNINKKNKKNKTIQDSFEKIKAVHDKLAKLNKLIDEKFNKLDKMFEDKSKELDGKLNDIDNKLDEKYKDKKWDME